MAPRSATIQVVIAGAWNTGKERRGVPGVEIRFSMQLHLGRHVAALARKILVIAWAMLRDSSPYQDPGQDPGEPVRSDGLHERKLRILKKKAQRSMKTISVWEALHLLATDHKLRAELGLRRIVTTPTTPTPSSRITPRKAST